MFIFEIPKLILSFFFKILLFALLLDGFMLLMGHSEFPNDTLDLGKFNRMLFSGGKMENVEARTPKKAP